MNKKIFNILKKVVDAVQALPFGKSIALPWCRESFPNLDQAMKEWEQLTAKEVDVKKILDIFSDWQTIETFPYPTKACDYDYPSFLFYSAETGIVKGYCVLFDIFDELYYEFHYDRDGLKIIPTHWMPLPEPPN